MTERFSRIFGTEDDKDTCSFYFKTGACRHGETCSKKHHKPSFSTTIMIPHMYVPFRHILNDKGAEQDFFEDFFEDVLREVSKIAPIEDLVVVQNLCEHMIGNVYIRFTHEDDAARAVQLLTNRYYNHVVLNPELSPVVDFRDSRCREHDVNTCKRGGLCNFMHIRPLPDWLKDILLTYSSSPQDRERGQNHYYGSSSHRNSGDSRGGRRGGGSDRGRRGGYGGQPRRDNDRYDRDYHHRDQDRDRQRGGHDRDRRSWDRDRAPSSRYEHYDDDRYGGSHDREGSSGRERSRGHSREDPSQYPPSSSRDHRYRDRGYAAAGDADDYSSSSRYPRGQQQQGLPPANDAPPGVSSRASAWDDTHTATQQRPPPSAVPPPHRQQHYQPQSDLTHSNEDLEDRF